MQEAQEEITMSGVGGVSGGGAGGAAAGAAAGAGAGAGAAAPAAATSHAGAVESTGAKGVDTNTNAPLKPLESGEHVPPMCEGGNMNTMNFIQLHNTSVTQVNETQGSGEVEWKKLIEMMMAIKLLQEMGKSQQ